MQQPSEPSSGSSSLPPSLTSSSFESLLAALTSPALSTKEPGSKPSEKRSVSAWDDGGLADDVATLSYESALKAHARYRPTDTSLTQLPDPVPFRFEEAAAATPQPAPGIPAYPAPRAAANPEPKLNRLSPLPAERNLKDASITIRMSKAECAQLHRRAAEAGLTVSAYLRSCTFEAESLRAMVKEAMAQLRSAQAQPQPRRFAFGRQAGKLARLFSR
jgi:hypothetical protein